MASSKEYNYTPNKRELQLPIARIKTIMKSSPDVETIGQDSLFLITKATELFIQLVAQRAYQMSGEIELNYKHIAEVIQTEEEFEFLREILPRKTKVKDLLMKASKNNEHSGSDSE
ncbi:hypothetical protein B566_EDAN016311 [Ephemera danica]|nr:hypothetical protein B566_EDAN016311 [Ephemera danica]